MLAALNWSKFQGAPQVYFEKFYFRIMNHMSLLYKDGRPHIYLTVFNIFIFEFQEYELRMYSDTNKWASTTIIGVDYDKATSEGFGRLFNYISGENGLSK